MCMFYKVAFALAVVWTTPPISDATCTDSTGTVRKTDETFSVDCSNTHKCDKSGDIFTLPKCGVRLLKPNCRLVSNPNIDLVKFENCCHLEVCHVCKVGTWGKDASCPGRCYCKTPKAACHILSGSCDKAGGCAVGYKGDSCSTSVCPVGRFLNQTTGNCDGFCHCVKNEACNPGNGFCSDAGGCAVGYTDSPVCQTQCKAGTFGINCAGRCRCNDVTETCKRSTGACVSGCAPGYRGVGCDLECAAGTFGLRCETKCNCANTTDVCRHTDGLCASGCPVGYAGPGCSDNCSPGTFGARFVMECQCGGMKGFALMICRTKCATERNNDKRCVGVCRCKNAAETCDHMTGACASGCALGYKGASCDQECKNGTYGSGCTGRCRCDDTKEVCRKSGGFCAVSGCPAGYTGTACQTKCERGTFGKNCALTCHCRDPTFVCNRLNGACKGGCAVGYTGASCQACTNRTFGLDCSKACRCQDAGEQCGVTTGVCVSGCEDGKEPPDCQIECQNMTFGPDCANQCHCQKTREPCAKNDVPGECFSGCGDGWTGVTCQERVEAATDVLTPLAIGLIAGGAALLVIILIVVLVVCCYRRRRNRDKSVKKVSHVTGQTIRQLGGEGETYEGIDEGDKAPVQETGDDHYYEGATVPVDDSGYLVMQPAYMELVKDDPSHNQHIPLTQVSSGDSFYNTQQKPETRPDVKPETDTRVDADTTNIDNETESTRVKSSVVPAVDNRFEPAYSPDIYENVESKYENIAYDGRGDRGFVSREESLSDLYENIMR